MSCLTITPDSPISASASFLISSPSMKTSGQGDGTRTGSQIGSSGLEMGQSELTASGSKIEKASKEFEALLIGQILKSARQSGEGGWMGTDSGDADSGMVELAEQQFASALSAQGGLGLGKLIQQGLKQSEKSVEAPPTTE